MISKLDTKPDLTFAPGQHLQRLAKQVRIQCLDRRGILSVQQIEKLKQDLKLDPLADIEALGKAHIEIDEGRRGESITTSARAMIDAVECPVAVRILGDCCSAAEVKPALSAEDAADLNLSGEYHQPVDLEDMIH